MKRILIKIGYFLGKYTWNAIIGIIFLALGTSFALIKVIGSRIAKAMMLFGMISFGADLLMVLFRAFDTFGDYVDVFAATLIVGLGPAFAVELVSAILEKITFAVRDNCFII